MGDKRDIPSKVMGAIAVAGFVGAVAASSGELLDQSNDISETTFDNIEIVEKIKEAEK